VIISQYIIVVSLISYLKPFSVFICSCDGDVVIVLNEIIVDLPIDAGRNTAASENVANDNVIAWPEYKTREFYEVENYGEVQSDEDHMINFNLDEKLYELSTRGHLMGLIPQHCVIFEEETAVVEAHIDEFQIGAFIEVKKRKNMDIEMMNILRRGPPRQYVTNHSDDMILPTPFRRIRTPTLCYISYDLVSIMPKSHAPG